MADNVVKFPTVTYAGRPDLLLADMLALAKDGGLSEVIILGVKPYGESEDGSTMGDADTLWHVEQFKVRLITP